MWLAMWLAGFAIASLCWASTGQIVQLQAGFKEANGLYEVQVEVGSPPKKLWVAVNSASEWFWLPASKLDYDLNSTSSGAKPLFSGGQEVHGAIVHEKVRLNEESALSVPVLLVENSSLLTRLAPDGMLGLACPHMAPVSTSAMNALTEDPQPQQAPADTAGSFFCTFWTQHPELKPNYRLELGGPVPRVVLGELLHEGSRLKGRFRPLANSFISRRGLWYAPLRAIGLSYGDTSPWATWNLDFNRKSAYGTPVLLDSGSASIHFSSVVFNHILRNLPNGCEGDPTGKTISCTCAGSATIKDFPSISLSFEAGDNFRILGLDVGREVLACIPASAYVTYDASVQRCKLAIADDGPIRVKYGYENIVLGVPFFKSAAVSFDLETQTLALGAAPGYVRPPSLVHGTPGSTQDDWAYSQVADPGQSVQTGPGMCHCADPKNWWATGKRLSPKRVVVVLVGVALLAVYIFIGYSPRAEFIRAYVGSESTGTAQTSGRINAGGQRPSADRPFMQMATRGSPGPE